MISAQKEKLNSFFQGSMKYIIPFFQRPYVWDEENWENLWENIFQTYTNYKNKKESEHFIGTLIIKQRPAEKLNENNYDLIDGQQRITTIFLLLKALENNCKEIGEYTELKNQIGQLLRFKDSKGQDHIRIEHNRIDTPYFDEIINSNSDTVFNNRENKLIKAYLFFDKKLKDFTDEEINDFNDIVLHKVPVISMLLAENDDEQEIFDTINSLGIKLTTAELLKNYIFKEKDIQDLYDDFWFNVFEADEETMSFWSTEKTSGRVYRTNIEVLLFCFLIIETRQEVRLDRLFKEYKKWIFSKTLPNKKEFLKELKEYGEIYSQFPSGEELNEISFTEQEKRFFHIIENLSITTIYPLIMFFYKKVTNEDERLECLKFIESYIVRRNICKYTTKNYNNVFIAIIQSIDSNDEDSTYIEKLKKVIFDFDDDSNLFPDDAEFKNAFRNSILSNQNAREILYVISLAQINNGLSDRDKLSSHSFSVEHMMPKKWEENWTEVHMNDDQKAIRNRKLKTLGNLTLITKRLNSKMKNESWIKKKNTLRQYSSLPMTINYLDNNWNEETIDIRADDLSTIAVRIWER